MANNLIILPGAEADMRQGYAWYERQREGLGDEFLEHVEVCFRRILANPRMHTAVLENYRRAVLRRFPYVILYEFADDVVTVYSVFHTSQVPEKWKSRLP